MKSKSNPKKKVCIIGAGASGLAAIRHVSESPDLEGVVFEMSESVGGLWVYSDNIRDVNGDPVHSSMYDSLRTHLPKELMAYPEFPFGDTKASFVTHIEMFRYMKRFTSHYNLSKHIRFSQKVINVQPIAPSEQSEEYPNNVPWMVTVEDLTSGTSSTYEFDSVIVCNGHCFKPFLPTIENQEVFEGEIVHSRDYRKPEIFKGKKVVVIGGGLSALDLATEIASAADEVIFSHKGKPLESNWLPRNVRQVPRVKFATSDGMHFEDDSSFVIDTVMLCTGYEYSYPFLSLECKVEVMRGKYVSPLYRHFIHAKYPSLAFFGLPFLNAAIPLFDCQARYFVKFLEGKVKLPSESEMKTEIEYEFNLKKNNGLTISKSHSMENSPWDHYKTLGEEAGFATDWVPLMKSIYNHVNERRAQFPTLYKNDKITVKNGNEYVYEAIEETTIIDEL